MSNTVRVRFAPSPTGPFHIGGARSALFNYLEAKHTGGTFVVRIEDTDQKRSTRESEENIKEALRWLGINWDEGIDVGGPDGPYRQMERLDIYKKYTDKLLAEGKAYYCFCTPEELEAEKEAQLAKGETPVYSGKCSHLSPEQVQQYLKEGRSYVIRVKTPKNETLEFDDLVRGHVAFDSNKVGDFVIVKSDGIPVYNYCVVMDDALMHITHVIRAEEHLSNTPRQLVLYKALGFPVPTFAHVSLILGKDKKKMSKRHGATSVQQYRDLGYLPQAIDNFLALLGWTPDSDQEIFSMEELCQQFSLDRVAKNPAVFDIEKLNWINFHYMKELDEDQLLEICLPHL
ncbi:MAG: glutamate--tRNA ligase, partial [Caecibacter massiliensis]|nr:glutamate--tRNA ligase [Caecibacter massiliensis]